MVRLLRNIVSYNTRINKAYDNVKEPKRFLLFIVPLMCILLFTTLVFGENSAPYNILILCGLFIPRLIHMW